MGRHPELRNLYLDEYAEFEGTQAFLNAKQSYPLLMGSQSNTYKCFVTRAWELGGECGVQGFLHPEGLYDDPKAGGFRRALYPRLKYHFQFQNEYPMFPDLGNREKFSVNVYGRVEIVRVRHISNLFHPITVDYCFGHAGGGACCGIKTDDGDWELGGHANRIINVDEEALRLFASVYDDPGTAAVEARLPCLHAQELLQVLARFSVYPIRLAQFTELYTTSEMWHETGAVKAGTIVRNTQFAPDLHSWVLSGPHIHVARPYFQTPKRVCDTHRAYDLLDLNELPEDYLPRTNFLPDCPPNVYRDRTPQVQWDEQKRITDFYQLLFRRQLSQAGERTMLPAIVPKGCGHIHTVLSIAFAEDRNLIRLASYASAIPYDFFVKTTGRGDLYESALRTLPLPTGSIALFARTLLLNCLTRYYADLWRGCWNTAVSAETWAKNDPRLPNDHFSSLSPTWSWRTPFRTDYERRQALVEIDVLVAMELGLSVDELCSIYRIQFPVLRQYERNTFYDRNGRIVFLDGDQLYGLSTPEWKKKHHQSIIKRTVTDDTLPGGPRERTIVYEGPFDQCDREEDYRTAWAEFARRQA